MIRGRKVMQELDLARSFNRVSIKHRLEVQMEVFFNIYTGASSLLHCTNKILIILLGNNCKNKIFTIFGFFTPRNEEIRSNLSQVPKSILDHQSRAMHQSVKSDCKEPQTRLPSENHSSSPIILLLNLRTEPFWES